MWIKVDSSRHILNPDFLQTLHSSGQSSGPAHPFVNKKRFDQLIGYPHVRIEGSHRILKNHRDSLPSNCAQLAARAAQKINPVESSNSGNYLSRRSGDQTEN